MMNSKYTQIKSLWKNKQILTEAAMDWKQSYGCFPSVGEFTSFINECLGETVFLSDETREINENDISRFASILAVLSEDAADKFAGMSDVQFEDWVERNKGAEAKARKLRAEGQARKTGRTATTESPRAQQTRSTQQGPSYSEQARERARQKASAAESERARQERARQWQEAADRRKAKPADATGAKPADATGVKPSKFAANLSKLAKFGVKLGTGVGLAALTDIALEKPGEAAAEALGIKDEKNKEDFKGIAVEPLSWAAGSIPFGKGAALRGGGYGLAFGLGQMLGRKGMEAIYGTEEEEDEELRKKAEEETKKTAVTQQQISQERETGIVGKAKEVRAEKIGQAAMSSPMWNDWMKDVNPDLYKKMNEELQLNEFVGGLGRLALKAVSTAVKVAPEVAKKEANRVVKTAVSSLPKSATPELIKQAENIAIKTAKEVVPEFSKVATKTRNLDDIFNKINWPIVPVSQRTGKATTEIAGAVKPVTALATKATTEIAGAVKPVTAPAAKAVEGIINAARVATRIIAAAKDASETASETATEITSATEPEDQTATSTETSTKTDAKTDTKTSTKTDTKTDTKTSTKTVTKPTTKTINQTKKSVKTGKSLGNILGKTIGSAIGSSIIKPFSFKNEESPEIPSEEENFNDLYAPGERYASEVRASAWDPFSGRYITKEKTINENEEKENKEILKDLYAARERYASKVRASAWDPFLKRYMTQEIMVNEGKLSPRESLKRKTQKQKYKVIYVQDGKKVEVFASSLRGVRRVIYGKKNFRVMNTTGSDLTGYFKKLMKND